MIGDTKQQNSFPACPHQVLRQHRPRYQRHQLCPLRQGNEQTFGPPLLILNKAVYLSIYLSNSRNPEPLISYGVFTPDRFILTLYKSTPRKYSKVLQNPSTKQYHTSWFFSDHGTSVSSLDAICHKNYFLIFCSASTSSSYSTSSSVSTSSSISTPTTTSVSTSVSTRYSRILVITQFLFKTRMQKSS